jgi:hypothetical protein
MQITGLLSLTRGGWAPPEAAAAAECCRCRRRMLPLPPRWMTDGLVMMMRDRGARGRRVGLKEKRGSVFRVKTLRVLRWGPRGWVCEESERICGCGWMLRTYVSAVSHVKYFLGRVTGHHGVVVV